jgi:hypothetical protein
LWGYTASRYLPIVVFSLSWGDFGYCIALSEFSIPLNPVVIAKSVATARKKATPRCTYHEKHPGMRWEGYTRPRRFPPSNRPEADDAMLDVVVELISEKKKKIQFARSKSAYILLLRF